MGRASPTPRGHATARLPGPARCHTGDRGRGPGHHRRAALPGRRKFLAYVTGGAVLAAAGGTTAWLATAFGDEKDPGGDGKERGETTAARPELRIGLQADLTGPSAATGKGQERAALLAVEEHNAREDAPFTLRLVVADDGGDEEKAKAAVRRFAEDPLVIAAIGATGADAAREALVAYDEVALPLLSVVDGDTRNLNRIFLSARPRNDMQMLPVAQYLGAKGLHTVALVDDGTEYGRQTTRFLDAGLRGNGRTVFAETVREGTADLDAEAGRIVAKKPGAVVYGGGWRDAARFARALTKAGFRGRGSGPRPCTIPGSWRRRARTRRGGWWCRRPPTPPPYPRWRLSRRPTASGSTGRRRCWPRRRTTRSG